MKKFSLISFLLVLTLLVLPKLVYAAKLTVDPSTKSVKVGDTFTLNIGLNTESQAVDGVDVHYLNYDKDKLEVQGATITAGVLFGMTPFNNVDATNGRIDFSQAATGGSNYNGSGTLATITFKALKEGAANLTFNYTYGTTSDCNVAAAGSDLLNGVTNGVVTISVATTSSSSSSSSSSTSSVSNSSSSDNKTTSTPVTNNSATTKKNLVSTGPATTILYGIAILIILVLAVAIIKKHFFVSKK